MRDAAIRLLTAIIAALLLTVATLPVPGGGAAAAQQAPPQLEIARSSLVAQGRDRGKPRPLVLTLAVSRLQPYRIMLLGEPPRLVVDVDGLAPGPRDARQPEGAGLVPAIRYGRIAGGRTRVVVELPGPMAIGEVTTQGGADPAIILHLAPVAAEDFRPEARGDALTALFGLPDPAAVPPVTRRAPRPLRVTLDPGHGGLDPGAVAEGVSEADLMLTFARELAASLRAAGVEVSLTRDSDVFLPLEQRMTLARGQAADLLLSLHADALPGGEAAGAAIYTWNAAADDGATARLAARHNRDDLLAGLDLSGADDEVAGALMDIARIDTRPRSQNMARFLVSEFALGRIAIRNRPVKSAAFSVLKAPDIPSVLIETGFLSDAGDRANLTDAHWRAELAGAITRAVLGWAEDDAARRPLLRH